jgi:hypothetical protein
MTKKVMVYLYLIFLLPLNTSLKAQDLSFLRYGGGARAYGMANTYTALAEGAEAVFWNPAFLESKNLVTSVIDYSKDHKKQLFFYGISYNLKKLNTGFSYYSNSVFDKKHSPKEQYIGISISSRLTGNLNIGTTFKLVSLQQRDFTRQKWYFFDIGTGFSILNNNLKFAIVIKDIFFLKNDAVGKIKPDCSYRVGIAYNFPKNEDNVSMTTSAEFVHKTDYSFYNWRDTYTSDPDYESSINIGNELNICETFFLRFSLSFPLNKDQGERTRLWGGFGLKLSAFMFDLGGSLDEETPVRISLKYGF